MRVEDQRGQLRRAVGAVHGDVRAHVGFHELQSSLCWRSVHVSRSQGEDAVDGGREVRGEGAAPDAAVGGLLPRNPRRAGLGRRELRDLGRYRCGAGGWCSGQQRGGRQQHGDANEGSTHQGAADVWHGSRFPDLDPENSAPAGSHRAPALVSRRWELNLTSRYPGSWCRLNDAPFTVADQRRSLTGFPSGAVQLQHVLLAVRYHGRPPATPADLWSAPRGEFRPGAQTVMAMDSSTNLGPVMIP